MENSSYNISTLRRAEAEGRVLYEGAWPWSDAAWRAQLGEVRAAARLAAKSAHTADPACHAVMLDHVDLSVTVKEGEALLETAVEAVTRADIAGHALLALTTAAAVLHNALRLEGARPRITDARIRRAAGSPERFGRVKTGAVQGAVLVVSDAVFHGEKEDAAGRLIAERLGELGVAVAHYEIAPDDAAVIAEQLTRLAEQLGRGVIVTTGGTGFSPRDCTPEAMERVVERWIPGIPEAARAFGQERTPYAMLSRGAAGIRGATLIVNLPGSRKGAAESLDALFPAVLHAMGALQGFGAAGKQAGAQPEP
jgi:cyclic pyranopterin monophosphate synthase